MPMDLADVSLHDLYKALRSSWSGSTSADAAGWRSRNELFGQATPSYGQCAVTALVVQQVCGGSLLRCEADGVSHYFNELPDGSTVDLTRDQFEPTTVFSAPAVRDRAYVLSFPETAARYDLLHDAVAVALAGKSAQLL